LILLDFPKTDDNHYHQIIKKRTLLYLSFVPVEIDYQPQ